MAPKSPAKKKKSSTKQQGQLVTSSKAPASGPYEVTAVASSSKVAPGRLILALRPKEDLKQKPALEWTNVPHGLRKDSTNISPAVERTPVVRKLARADSWPLDIISGTGRWKAGNFLPTREGGEPTWKKTLKDVKIRDPRDMKASVSRKSKYDYGTFATKALKPGDIILEEKPIIKFSNTDFKDKRAVETFCMIYGAFRRLTQSQRESVLQLASSMNKRQRDRIKDLAPSVDLQRIDEAETLISVWYSNCGQVEDNKTMLCTRFSRVNHACIPNATWNWNKLTEIHSIRALKPIDKGEQ